MPSAHRPSSTACMSCRCRSERLDPERFARNPKHLVPGRVSPFRSPSPAAWLPFVRPSRPCCSCAWGPSPPLRSHEATPAPPPPDLRDAFRAYFAPFLGHSSCSVTRAPDVTCATKCPGLLSMAPNENSFAPNDTMSTRQFRKPARRLDDRQRVARRHKTPSAYRALGDWCKRTGSVFAAARASLGSSCRCSR